jgi:2,3-dihydroxyphenylpropionate 1,2-dioxygenase
MARIVAACALSHSPLMNIPRAPADDAERIERYRAITARLADRLREAAPEVYLIIAQDHFRSLFYDNMPAFCIGTGRVDGWGDWATSKGPFNNDLKLARHLHRSLLAADFEPACSYDLRIDHGIAQPLQLLDLPDSVPMVPILINTGAPPLPTPRRCYAFGQALTRAIERYAGDTRVAVIGSGGISHAPPSWNVESTDPALTDRIERLIHGRAAVNANEQARQDGLVEAVLAGKFADSIREDWDRAFLAALARGGAAQMAESLDEASIERDGGYGGQEIRTWLAAAGTVDGRAMTTLGYEPIPYLITGMGAVIA